MPLHLTKQFKRAIQDDPSKCVLFVGAGLSASGVRHGGQGLPDWHTLMQHMIEDLQDSENCNPAFLISLNESLEAGRYLEIARTFKQKTRPDQFCAFLRAELDPPDIVPSRIHEIILKISFRGIITTNFDMVFESQSDRLRPLVYPQFLADPSTIHREKFLAKIHGCIRQTPNLAEDLILTDEGYAALRSDRRYRTLMNVLLLGYRILTVGFSLQDPDFLGLIEDLRDIFGDGLPTIYALMAKSDQATRDSWQRRGVEIIPYENHRELVGFFEELLTVSEARYPVPAVIPVSRESDVNYDALLEKWERATKIDESDEILATQLTRLPSNEQKESFLFQFLALVGRQHRVLLAPHLLALGTEASQRVLASLLQKAEDEEQWQHFAPHPMHRDVHRWVLEHWPDFSNSFFQYGNRNRTFEWLLRKEWAEHGIDLWEIFLSLLNRIVSSGQLNLLDDLYDVSSHIQGAVERIEKIALSPGFIREDDPEARWYKSWDEQVVNHIQYEKFQRVINSGTVGDYREQLAEARKQGYMRFVVGRMLEQYVHYTHLTLHSSSGLYDPQKAHDILEGLAELEHRDDQLTVLWAIDHWPEEMRGLISLGEDTKSLRTGLFIPLWWRFSSETRVEYLRGRKHGKMHEAFWGTGQELLLEDMMGLDYDIDQDFRNAFDASLDDHRATNGPYKYEPRPFEEIWSDRELTYRFSDDTPPELIRRVAVKRVDWENSQAGSVRWREALQRAGSHLESRQLAGYVSAEKQDYVIDNLLGAYFPSQVEVVLYPRMIQYASENLGIDSEALGTVVYIHETVHAFSHIGKDHDGRWWTDFSLPMSEWPDFEPSRPHEAIAQYYTHQLIEAVHDQRLMNAFLTLEQHCREVYRAWRATERYTLEEMRKILVEYRRRAIDWPPSLAL